MSDDKITYFGETNFRNKRVKFGIKTDDRRRHMYLIGKTGMGKSTVMENMIIQDIINGEGVALVDPHGDLAEKIIDYIPSSRINDVVYFNPADIEFPVAFNVIETVSPEYKHLIASGMVGVFKKLWADSWGPRLEYVLRNAILALLDYPGSTLLGVMRILVDKNYRKKVIEKIQDPVVKSFWVDEYSKYPQQFQTEAIAPIQNKVGQFLSTALIRNVVGQVKSTIDLREIMDNRKILIMNLSKGRIGEDASALMGAMMITKLQLAAMSRIDVPEEDRKDFYLYVDEFQNFATDSFANILSEARKYRLNLIIAHQYIEQLSEVVRPAVFGNVGTMAVFRIGSIDAEAMTVEFEPYFTPEDLVNLAKYDIYMKLMIDGVSSNPFSATTLPPLPKPENSAARDKVIRVSRERYGKPRDVVEDKISRWSGVMDESGDGTEGVENEVEKPRFRRTTNDAPRPPRPLPQPPSTPRSALVQNNTPDRDTLPAPSFKKPALVAPVKPTIGSAKKTTYTVNCYECGKLTEVGFKPDGVRPIYCATCFQEIKKKMLKPEQSVAEVASPPAKEISLTEALQKPPMSFDGKKIIPTADKAKKMTIEEHIEKKKIAITLPIINPNETVDKPSVTKISNNDPRIIKPGEVIKI